MSVMETLLIFALSIIPQKAREVSTDAG
jgi:hypothetical protein